MDGVMATVDWAQEVEALYRDDGDRLWRALRAWSGDAEVASESMAEAFAQALRRGPAVRDPAAWVWKAAFRIAAGELKASRERATSAALPDGPHHDRYGDPDLLAALQQLPAAQRAAVILYYYADLPLPQIAARLGSNRLAVAANLSRGRRRLQVLLGDDHG